jgi:hypothetical protein
MSRQMRYSDRETSIIRILLESKNPRVRPTTQAIIVAPEGGIREISRNTIYYT